jgi:hypothetical protein
MKKTTYKRLIVVIALISIFLLAIFSKIVYTMINDHETSSKVPLIEHYNLFTKEAQNKLELLATTTSRNRETTSNYVYDKTFNVFVLKVILANNNGLKDIISYQNESSHVTMNAVYSDLSNYNMKMKIKSGKSVTASTVHFKFNGNSIKSIASNDSLYCYYYKFSTFSIGYNNEPYDIIAKADQSNIPASLIFKKKDKFLYVIIMSVAKGKEEMQPDQLYNIINK